MRKHFSFLHCADLHLGEPFAGICPEMSGPWTSAINKATFKSFEKIIDVAIESRVDAILISGDIYNSENHSLAAQMAFARELYRAAQVGIHTFVVHGNHDPKEAWRADIPLPESVHVFSSDDVESVILKKDGEDVAAIYGMSFKTKHITENLSLKFKNKNKNLFSIGMLHTDVGKSEGVYAPCTINDLKKSGMDYWALGHIHKRKIISEKPYIVYPGNIQGLDITETGAKGCYIVDVGAFGTVTPKFVETDALRWVDLTIDISEFNQTEDLLNEITKRRLLLREQTGRPNIIRLIFTGRGILHKAVSSKDGQEYILHMLNDKERFRHIFSYFARIDDYTNISIDLEERRNLPDIVGNYLSAYDEIKMTNKEDKIKILNDMLNKSPEFEKLKKSIYKIDEKLLIRAFERAEIAGVEMLAEEENENN
jgi:hypothetical protein